MRYYRHLGPKWGWTYLVLLCTLLVSMVVLVPLSVGLGLIAVAIYLFCALTLWLLSIMGSNHPVVVNNYYYNRYYVTR